MASVRRDRDEGDKTPVPVVHPGTQGFLAERRHVAPQQHRRRNTGELTHARENGEIS